MHVLAGKRDLFHTSSGTEINSILIIKKRFSLQTIKKMILSGEL